MAKKGEPKTVWVVVEEPETGTYADGVTYCLLSAHLTEESAQTAIDGWRLEHCGSEGYAHAFEPEGQDSPWCGECRCGVSMAELEVVT